MDISKFYIANEQGVRLLYSGYADYAHGGYNPDEPDKIYSKVLEVMIPTINDLPDGSSVLMMGGGTFTLPRFIKPTISLTVVEISQPVIEAAEQFFGWVPSEHPNVTTLVADAADVSQFSPCDVIFVDLLPAEAPFVADTAYYEKLIALAPKIYANLCYVPVPEWAGPTHLTQLGENWTLAEFQRPKK